MNKLDIVTWPIQEPTRELYIDRVSELEMLFSEEMNQQEQDLNPPDNDGWNGVF